MKQIIYLGGKKAREYDGVDEPTIPETDEEINKILGNTTKKLHKIALRAYKAHISTLPVFDVIGDCDWKEGEVKTEGVDYEVKEQLFVFHVNKWIDAPPGTSWTYSATPSRTVIVPIPKKQEGEENIYDSIYMEVVELVEKDNIQCEEYKATAEKLKQKFTITRKS